MEIEGKYELDGLFTSISTDIKFSVFGADEDTPVTWGDVASGTCYYYFRDISGTSVKSGRYFFNTNSSSSSGVFSSPSMDVLLVPVESPSGNAEKTLTVSGSTINFGSGSFMRFHNSLYPYSELNVNQISVTTNTTMYTYDSTLTVPPTWRFLGGAGGYPEYTTSSAVHNSFPHSSYLPISGRTMSYNDIKTYVINEWNGKNPDNPITENDIPEFDETEPTEQATGDTGDYQPFSIDYNEILGERELESILKETQYVLDTTPAESIDFSFSETLPEISAPDSRIVSTVGKIFEMHKNIVPSELVAIWGGLAVFAVLFWWVTK